MITMDELNALKEEVVTLKKKLAELTEEELKQVIGGHNDVDDPYCPFCSFNKLVLHECDPWKQIDWYNCHKCGNITHFWIGDRWAKGWITE